MSVAQIQRIVSEHFAFPAEIMRTEKRYQGCTNALTECCARQIAMYLAREYTSLSQAAIGRHFGGRERTTVRDGCRRVAKMTANGKLTQTVAALRLQIEALQS